jgi:tetratricopeptide (TPR) repeat protein
MSDPTRVLHNTYLALKDKAHHESMMQYLAATYMLEKDTARSVETLKEGFHAYPKSSYFYAHLIDYYSKRSEWKEASDLTDKAIEADSTNATAWLAKSTLLINTGDYEHSFLIADSLLKRDSTMTEAWLNAGLAKFNMGVNLDKNPQSVRQKRQQILKYYKEALPYLEQYRRLAPKETDKWALPLYTIYLNLNMGKQFDEIDKILRNKS